MDFRKLKTAHKRALKAKGEMHSQCEIMEEIIQPFFEDEISVLYQQGDGFVVLHSSLYLNTPIDEVIENLKKNVNSFRKK